MIRNFLINVLLTILTNKMYVLLNENITQMCTSKTNYKESQDSGGRAIDE